MSRRLWGIARLALGVLLVPLLPLCAQDSGQIKLSQSLEWPTPNEYSLRLTVEIPRGCAYALVNESPGTDGALKPHAIIAGGRIPTNYPAPKYEISLFRSGKINEGKQKPGLVWFDYSSGWKCPSVFPTFYLTGGTGGNASLGSYISNAKPLSRLVYVRLSDLLSEKSPPFPLDTKNLLFTIATPFVSDHVEVESVYLMVSPDAAKLKKAFSKYLNSKIANEDIKWAFYDTGHASKN